MSFPMLLTPACLLLMLGVYIHTKKCTYIPVRTVSMLFSVFRKSLLNFHGLAGGIGRAVFQERAGCAHVALKFQAVAPGKPG